MCCYILSPMVTFDISYHIHVQCTLMTLITLPAHLYWNANR